MHYVMVAHIFKCFDLPLLWLILKRFTIIIYDYGAVLYANISFTASSSQARQGTFWFLEPSDIYHQHHHPAPLKRRQHAQSWGNEDVCVQTYLDL